MIGLSLKNRSICYGTGGDFVARLLYELGIEFVFSIPGSQVLPVWGGISRQGSIKIVVPRNERTAAFMGEGYSRASGFPSVVISTLGPGVANELPGIYSARLSNAPVLFISPYQPSYKYSRIGEIFQGLNHSQFFKDVCKRNLIIEKHSELYNIINMGFNECLKDPAGPVRVDISFPILFERFLIYGRSSVKEPQGMHKTYDSAIFVFEAEEDSAGAELEGLDEYLNKENLFYPGIKEQGFGLPFALGAKFACHEIPVVVFTTHEFLLNNLDILAVAGSYNLPVNIVYKHPETARISDTFGINSTKMDKYSLRDALIKDKKSLTCIIL